MEHLVDFPTLTWYTCRTPTTPFLSLGTIQSILLVKPLSTSTTTLLSRGTVHCLLLVRPRRTPHAAALLSLGKIEYIRLVRPQSKILDFPILTEYNTVHTFSQTPVENSRLCTIQCILLVRPLSKRIEVPALCTVQCIL